MEKQVAICGSQKPCEAIKPDKCSNHRKKCGLQEICGAAAPQTNEGVFTFGQLGSFQEFAVLQISPILPS